MATPAEKAAADRLIQLERFERLVKGMRQAQKNYFKTRDSAILQRSKEAEKRVDKYLEGKRLDDMLAIEPEVKQYDCLNFFEGLE